MLVCRLSNNKNTKGELNKPIVLKLVKCSSKESSQSSKNSSNLLYHTTFLIYKLQVYNARQVIIQQKLLLIVKPGITYYQIFALNNDTILRPNDTLYKASFASIFTSGYHHLPKIQIKSKPNPSRTRNVEIE